MKAIILIISSLLIFSCAANRKVNKEKIENIENKEQVTQSTELLESESKVDLNKMLENTSISIVSKGTPYQLSYNGIIFSGDADLNIGKKIEKTSYKTITKTKFYKIFKNYIITKTIYKTETKSIDKTDNIWYSVFIGSIFFILGWYLSSKFGFKIKL